MSIKKNFFAPWALGLGATRRAAILQLVMMLTMAQTAWAQGGSCGNHLTWVLTGKSTNYTLTISGSGAMADYASAAAQPWKDYRSSIKTVVIRNGVTSIGKYAFNGCSSLKSVTFAEGSELTSIGERAFYGTDLKSIEIPASVTSIGERAFSGSSLGSVTFADGSRLESIGEYAFSSTGLTSIEIPASVTSIGERAFSGCSNLEAITVEDGNTVFDSRNNCNAIIEKLSNTLIAGCKNTTIPDGVTSIGNYTFAYCTGLTSIEIPASVTSIGDYTFYGCTGLASIEIPAGVTSIGDYTFYGCTGLTSIEIPASVTSIGGTAFKNCSNLATVTVYAPSCTLGANAFANCNSLANIYVFSDLEDDYKDAWSDYTSIITGITGGYCGATGHETDVVWVLTGESPNCTLTISGTGAMADYASSSVQPWKDYRSSIKTVVIGAGVTSLGKYTFYATRLTSIEIPASVTSIGERAFYGTRLTSIEIPASVTSIGKYAFSTCNGLGSVTFAEGSQLTSIGMFAFENCYVLTSITIPARVTSIGSDVFQNCNNLASITVEDGNTVYDSRNGCNAIIVKSTNTLIIGCKNSTIPASVTSIGNYAFYTTRLTSIEIPASVTSIGMRAFQNCPNLATVTVYAPSCSLGEDAFANCNNLANIYVFSDLVDDYQGAENWSDYKSIIKGIGGYCGATDHETDVVWALTGESTNCTLTISGTGAMADYASSSVQPWNDYRSSIKTVVIGNGVTSIGNYTFAKCTGLTSIEIPASVTSIGDNAFWECSNLATVTFAEDSQLATIGISAFSTCRGLASVEIPASVTSIGNNAFSTCNGLGSVTFAEGSQLTSIGNNAFQLCSNLTSITIPASVTSIGSYAFLNCDLASITVADGNTVYDSRNGCNAIIVKSTNTLIIGCKNSTIPASVTSIGERAFYNTGLTSIEIPASVTSIGGSAFYGCSGLTGIEIPASVTNIGGSAFYGCSGLTSIEIPASVTSIRSIAFRNCSNLATVTVYALECSLGEDAFLNCDKLTNIYVFSDKVAFYQGAEHWSAYKDIITALPTVTTSYVDADGTLHEGAVPLNNAMTTLPAGWYVVNSDISYTGTITLNGDVNIILADGKTMTASGNSHGIYGDGSLTIYGQALGTGILTVTSTNDVGIRVVDGVTINGGTVNATGIFSDGDITINGGKVTSTIDPGICSNSGTIILGLRNATDYITAESYSASLGIIVKAGQTLTDGTSTYSGTLTDEQKIAIAEKVLTAPTYSVTANRATKEDTEYWSTFYHPAAGYTADENTTVYQAAVNTTTNKVELTAVPGREIPADKAVVLKSTQSAITLSRATTTQTLDGNELKGGATVADGTVPYTLAAKGGTVGFYKFVGAALNPNKAHLEITAPAQSAPAFFGFEENTTAINEHELHESHELSGAWYTLDGRKLSGKPSAKGIYVRNGRKFIIK